MGCMGVIYALTLEVEPAFWLDEVRTLASWGELKQPGGFVDRATRRELTAATDADYHEVYFSPYPPRGKTRPEDHLCVLTRRFKLPRFPGPLSNNQRKRGRYGEAPLQAMTQLTRQGDALVDVLNAAPEFVPLFHDLSLGGILDSTFVAPSYRVFNLGVVNGMRADGIEMAFDLRDAVRAVESVFTLARTQAEKGRMHSTPPSLRFVKRSDALLAMQSGRDTAHIEMGMLVCADGGPELLRDYERELMRLHGARPHWGLDQSILQGWGEVEALYGDAARRWRAVYARMNSAGTFNGRFTDRLGISV
jgi:L-gulono-1,4-lactone dehydrogenase